MDSTPGSVTYSSDTMFVGDATWDASRNSYLLPNLQGLNFDTMRYNGMGNRFSKDTRYHALIIAHGVIAALVFLLISPLAVFIAKFYHADGHRALRLHVTLQVLSTILLTVVIVLGVLAVGSKRAFSNPHHGIGIAIYIAVFLQAVGGAIIRQTEKRKRRPYQLPVRLMLHKWFGRGVVLLGIAQVALGLTLYGSPLWLFVMYAVVVGVWLSLLFYYCQEMQYSDPNPPTPRGSRRSRQEARYQVPMAQPGIQQQQQQQQQRQQQQQQQQHRMLTHHSDRSSSRGRGRRHDRQTKDHHYLRDAALGVGAASAYHHWRNRSRDGQSTRYYNNQNAQHQPQSTNQELPPTPHSYNPSLDEKSPEDANDHTWRDRILGTGAGVAAYQGGRSILHGNRRDSASHSVDKPPMTPIYLPPSPSNHISPYRVPSPHVTFATPPHSSQASSPGLQPVDRMYREQVMAAQRLGSEDGSSVDGYSHGVLGTLAAVSGVAAIRSRLRERQERREQERLDQMTRIDQYNEQRLSRSYSRQIRRERDKVERRHDWEPTSTLSTFDGSQTYSPPVQNRTVPVLPMAALTPLAIPRNDAASSPRMPLASHRPDLPGPPLSMPDAAEAGLASFPAQTQDFRSDQPSAADTRFGEDSSIQASPVILPAPPAVTTRSQEYIAPSEPPIHVAAERLPEPPSAAIRGIHPSPQEAINGAAQLGLAPPGPPSYTQSQSQANDADGSIYSGSVSMSSVRMTEPPVSVKVRIHNNQRQVTMRKLNSAEIAAERARQGGQQQRATSSNSGVEVSEIARGGQRPVMTPPGAPSAAAATPYAVGATGNRTHESLGFTTNNADGYSSPGAGTGTSEASAAFEQNRRRRRAERTSPQTREGTTAPRVM